MLNTDRLVVHADDLTQVVGVMYSDIPILEITENKQAVRNAVETQRIIRQSSGESIPAEILPGEILCADHVIRRATAEARQQNQYMPDYFSGKKVGISMARRSSLAGEMVMWRPDRNVGPEEYAVIVDYSAEEKA